MKGWDGPVEMDWDVALSELRFAIQRNVPVRMGTLWRSFRNPNTTTINAAKDTIVITVPPGDPAHDYARIQDDGGYIPPYQSPPGKVMRAEIPQGSGIFRFFTKRKGFHLPGYNYINNAVYEWWHGVKPVIVRWRAGIAGGGVGWRSGPAGQGLRDIEGGTTSAP